MTEACAVPVSGWTVLRAVKWTVLHAVRWTRVIGTGVVLLVAALFIQPPAQGAPAAPAKADPSLYAQSVAHPSETFPVIVREAAPNTDSAESLVKSLGGRVTHELGIVGGFSALVPGSAVPELSASPLVWRVWGDAPLPMQGVSMGQYDYAAANTVWKQVINLPKTNNQYTGAGVTVALVDTGVVPMPDLASRILHAVDLTGEADGLDRYGHGTHMAGIIAGTGAASGGTYSGVAPGANLVSIKVAGLDGSTDASVVMAGLQWAVTHRAQYNIKTNAVAPIAATRMTEDILPKEVLDKLTPEYVAPVVAYLCTEEVPETASIFIVGGGKVQRAALFHDTATRVYRIAL